MTSDMASFWDERARENAAYFVDNQLDYAHPDMERFWAEGKRTVDAVLGALGLALSGDEDVVELGCGIGRLTRVLAARAASVRALDVSEEMLRRAREANPGLDVEWLHCDGRSLTGVADASADAFFSHVVFQHVPEPEITYGYVDEIGRVLRPGGWAAFQVSDDPSVHRPPRRKWLRRGPKGQDHPAWVGSAVDLDVLRKRAEAAGCPVERVEGAGTQFCLVGLRRA
jgi:SAM-dependent methyltransferase